MEDGVGDGACCEERRLVGIAGSEMVEGRDGRDEFLVGCGTHALLGVIGEDEGVGREVEHADAHLGAFEDIVVEEMAQTLFEREIGIGVISLGGFDGVIVLSLVGSGYGVGRDGVGGRSVERCVRAHAGFAMHESRKAEKEGEDKGIYDSSHDGVE